MTVASHAHCNHHDAGSMTEGKLRLSLALTFCFVVVEALTGLRSHSLALLSDSGHNFSDGFALLLSWYALRVARKPATATKTYGFHRVGILTALFNALLLMGLALLIFVEAYHLFLHPQRVQSTPMIVVASVAVVMNTVIALALRGEAKHDVNLRGAYIHMAGDALSSLGVIIAGLAIRFTHWPYADPLVSTLIGMFILYASWGIVQETINILLEGTPRGLDMNGLVRDIHAVPGIADVHDLHVWTIANGMNALSCHIVLCEADAPHASVVVQNVKQRLLHDYSIPHSTIETECGGCPSSTLYCQLNDSHASDHQDCHHHHLHA